MTDETEQTESPETDQKQHTHSDQAFFDYLVQQYSAGPLRQLFRTVRRGLFVEESETSNIVEHYRQWLQETTGADTAKSIEKTKRKLFGEDAPRLFYLLDGKTCLPGHLIERDLDNHLQKHIPYSQSALLETENYIHPRDPALANIQGVKSNFDNSKGFRFFIEMPEKTVSFTTDFLTQFGNVIKNTPSLVKENPSIRGPLRACISLLVEDLKKAHTLKDNQRLLVPTQFSKHPAELFYLTEHAVFVSDEKNALISCYGLNRKNIKALISQELAKETKTRVKNVRLIFNDSWKAGTIKINHKLYIIHQDIICEALLRADRSPRLRKACAGRHTVFSCFNEIADILKEATLVIKPRDKKEDAKKKTNSKHGDTVSYLKFQNWTFTIAGKNVISSFEEKLNPKGKSKPKQVKAKEPEAKPAAPSQ